MLIVDISDSLKSFAFGYKRMHRPVVKLSNITLTAVDKHYIIWRNLYYYLDPIAGFHP